MSNITNQDRPDNLHTLRLYLPRAAQSLDPRFGADRISGIVVNMLYEGLMRFDREDNIEPAIASDVSITDDFTKYVFKLKKASWSNGSPLTAYDFEYAWKKILEPDFFSPYSFLFFAIKNAEAAKKGEKPINQVGIYALDEQTLSVDLEIPAPYFLSLTANWIFFPLCREIDQQHPGWAYHNSDSYICNGPFKLHLWKLNDDLILVKNPLYREASSVKLKRIEISIIEDENKALELFNADKLDWLGDPIKKIHPEAIPQLIAKDRLKTGGVYGLFWLQINTKTLPFTSSKMRQAFAYAINRKELVEQVLHIKDVPAYGISTLSTQQDYFNEQEALSLFEEGLKELNLKKSDLPTLTFTHSDDYGEQEAIAHSVGKKWQELFGIKVEYKRLIWNSYFAALHNQDFMVGGLMWYPRHDDPIFYFDLLIYREYSVCVTKWKDPLYSKLVEQAKQSLNPTIRKNLLHEAEKILFEQMPVIPLFFDRFHYAKNPELKNYFFSKNQIDFREAYKN